MLDYCEYCVTKDVHAGLIDGYDKEDLKNYKPAQAYHDNHGYFLFFACEDCLTEQKNKYDPIVFDNYAAYDEKVAANGERFE
ncbi:MAG: hypothetical protein CMC15_16420 [Flavobacteriaceae bacterium]|nr:hypothetical protein [Flavobacteriaceae bacterium]|tara:strand:+ start:590 stop:835 length:246 start_codon:yes stop_codon:yes gene_type:complete